MRTGPSTKMWSRLIAVKNHQEHRVQAEISRIDAQIDAQRRALEQVHRHRIESVQRWREQSQKTWTGRADQLPDLRGALSGFYVADVRFQQEGERLQREIEALQKQRAELEAELKRCIKKQEKLRFIQRKGL